MEQYIADKKLIGVVITDLKTPSGNEMVEVNFEDGSKELMPKMRFEIIVSDEVSDASTVQGKIEQKVGATLFGTLHEFGIKMGEIEEILNQVSTFANNGYEKARDIKWGFTHRFLPLIEINKVLIEDNASKENNNGTTSSGSGTDTENKG